MYQHKICFLGSISEISIWQRMEVEESEIGYQACHDATELDDVGIGDRIQAPDQRVKDGDTGR